jgi:hypothetical protein
MDVPQQLQQVRIFIDENRVITFLEEMSRGVKRGLDLACVSARDSQHDHAERRICHLDQRMDVVGHPAICVHARAEPIDDLGDDLVQDLPVRRPKEDVLAMIAAHGDVIERSRRVNTKRSRHPCLSRSMDTDLIATEALSERAFLDKLPTTALSRFPGPAPSTLSHSLTAGGRSLLILSANNT